MKEAKDWSDARWWLWNYIWFPIRHPRQFLCDRRIVCCDLHPRTAHSRLAFRKRLRARRVYSYAGWTQQELDELKREIAGG